MKFVVLPLRPALSFTHLLKKFTLYLFLLCQASSGQAASLDWVAVNSGLSDLRVRSMAADSKGNLYVGTEYNGVFKSSSTSPVWTKISNGLTNLYVNAILISSDDTIYTATNSGLFKSNDGGASWTLAADAMSNHTISSVIEDEKGNLYAAAFDGYTTYSIFRSTDSGVTWSSILSSTEIGIGPLIVDKADNLFIGTGNSIYKCGTDGSNLTEASNGLVLIPGLYAGTAPTQVVQTFNIDADGNVYAGTQGGIFKSSDGGAHWALIGLDRQRVQAIVFDSNGQMYAGTGDGDYDPGYVYRRDGTSSDFVQVRSQLSQTVQAMTVDANGNVNAGTYETGVFQTNVDAFTINGVTSGSSSTSISVNADIAVAYNDLGKSGFVFVHATHPLLGEFLLGPNGWISTNIAASALEDIVAHSTVTLGTHSIPVVSLTPFDLVVLKGTVISAGYGTSASDVLNKQTYDVIYTIQ